MKFLIDFKQKKTPGKIKSSLAEVKCSYDTKIAQSIRIQKKVLDVATLFAQFVILSTVLFKVVIIIIIINRHFKTLN